MKSIDQWWSSNNCSTWKEDDVDNKAWSAVFVPCHRLLMNGGVGNGQQPSATNSHLCTTQAHTHAYVKPCTCAYAHMCTICAHSTPIQHTICRPITTALHWCKHTACKKYKTNSQWCSPCKKHQWRLHQTFIAHFKNSHWWTAWHICTKNINIQQSKMTKSSSQVW